MEMRFGNNTNLVNEVIDFVRESALFSRGYRDPLGLSETVIDFGRALELSRTQNPESDEVVWADLLGRMMSRVRAARYKIEGFRPIDDELLALSDEFATVLDARLKGSILHEVRYEI